MTDRVQLPPRVVVDDTTNTIVGMRDAADRPVTMGIGTLPAAVQSLVSGGGNSVVPTVALLGDSRTASTKNGNTLNADWFPLANAISSGAFTIAYFGGVSGETTAQVATRVPAAIASGAKFAFLLCGTNDGWTTQAEVDASLATRHAMTAALIAGGVYVFSLSELPNTTKSSAWHDLAAYFNLQERLDWQNRPGGEFLDVFSPLLVAATGIGAAGYFHDGLHQNVLGAWRMAQVIAPRIQKFKTTPYRPLAPSVRDYYDTNPLSQNRVPNPLMLGTGGTLGGGSGQLPDGYNGANTATCTFSVVARADGVGNDAKVVATATAGQIVLIYQALAHADFVVGSRWVSRCEITIESATKLNEFRCSVFSDKWNFSALGAIQANGGLDLSAPVTLILESLEFTVEAGQQPDSYVLCSFELKWPSGVAGAATARIGRLSVDRVA